MLHAEGIMKLISISKTHLVSLLAALALAFAALTLPTSQVLGIEPITVTNSDDEGEGSLRKAIADSSDGGIIYFDNNYSISLKSELVINRNLTIDGEDHTIILYGGDSVRVFYVKTSISVDLNHLAVSQGYSGSDFGGGLYNLGSLTITNSTFSGNKTNYGGGIFNDNSGTLTITNSTFSGNSANNQGGGIFNENNGVVHVTNSTFSANGAMEEGAGGNIGNKSGNLTLRNTIVASSPSGVNCYGTITDGGGNLTWGDSSCPGINSDPKLNALGNYGGLTETFALLPGSAAINTGNNTTCSAAPVNGFDQRGVTRPSLCDIGAFESGGFTLNVSGGNNQIAGLNTAFSNPLQVSVSPLFAGEPVDGGTVVFIPPGSDASALITGSPAAISGGHAQVMATAIGVIGSYNVSTSTIGASTSVNFALQNTCEGSSISVGNSDDSGTGSLRQAIANICAGGTITFAGDTTVYLASTLTIDKNMTIDGTGHIVTISGDTGGDGSGNVRVFYVNTSVTFDLKNVTVTKGTSTTFGGGILNYGTTTILNSTFSGNSAASNGGAINNQAGPLNVINSTFSGNSATGNGGAINNQAGNLIVTNSTISGNSANHGGGLSFISGMLQLRSTIVANNSSGGNCWGGITDGGSNLVWGDSTCPGINANPRLSALGNYGGPTQTFGLLPGSAAINSGNDDVCSLPVFAYGPGWLDQRGAARPHLGGCDMGAFESLGFTLSASGGNYQSATIYTAFPAPLQVGISPVSAGEPVDGGTVAFTAPGSGASAVLIGSPAAISGGHAQVTATANAFFGSYNVNASTNGASSPVDFALENTCVYSSLTVGNGNDSGAGSLRQAMADLCTGGTITFSGDTIIYLASTLTIDKSMTIDGSGHSVTVSGDTGGDGSGDVRVFYVNSGSTVILNFLTVKKGKPGLGLNPNGSGIYNAGTLTISNCFISQNVDGFYGTGIYNNGTLTISNCFISQNGSGGYGGGLYNENGSATITDSTFWFNGADNGAGIYNNNSSITITNSVFNRNAALNKGGGVYNSANSTLTITNSTFSENSSRTGVSVGGIYNAGAVTLRNSMVVSSVGANCSSTMTDGGGNLVWGDSTCPGINANPRLTDLGYYGGPTQTIALLPGSAAIDAGLDATCSAAVGAPNYGAGGLDQRGVTRPQGTQCDIGAFESRGFTLTVSGGNNQSAGLNTAFTNPLQVSVSPVSAGEPVNGGTVAFIPPGSDASALITGSPATISGGHAQVTATAIGVTGSYHVSASTSGAASGVNFTLQNTCGNNLTVANSNDSGAGSLRQVMADLCPGGKITFAGDTTVYLASTLTIDKNMTIDGAGHTVTISGDTGGDGSGNVRVFYVNSSLTFNLKNLAVTKGYVSGSGGGLYNNSAAVTVTNSTFSENSANSGGSITNSSGTVNITNSTFSANHASSAGRGLFNFGGTVNITNSTFSANSAVADGGGGIRNFDGSLTLRNSIVASSSSGGNCSGTITDGGGNLAWGDSTCPGINADPKLGALANNGGPTQTLALLPGSAAIGAGLDATCSAAVGAPNYGAGGLDQRGIARPQGTHCDIGAFESRGFTLTVSGGNNQSAVLNTTFSNPLQVSVSPVSAGEPVDGGTVIFTPPGSGASALITGSPATISGGHAQVTAIAIGVIGSYNVSASTIGASTSVNFALQNTCEGSSISVGNSNDSGSGSLRQAIANICAGGTITFTGDTTVYLASTLTIDKNMTIDGSGHSVTVSGDTGGDGSGNVRVFYVNSSLTFNLKNLAVTKGYVSGSGGGLYNNSGAVTITNSTFFANSANSGGSITNSSGTVNITNSTFSANNANSAGGGLFNFGGTVNITNSTFSANSAVEEGGGIRNFDGSLTLRNSIVASSPSGGNCTGTITDGGGNLAWGDSTCPGINADPKLGTLANNGGYTQTIALLPGSAAIDAGNDAACPATDQRGVTRPSPCDIGAYELAQFIISGNAGVADAILSYSDGLTTGTATAGVDGEYLFFVPSGWSGTVTLSLPGMGFSPESRIYINILEDKSGQNYTAFYAIYLPLVKR